MEQETPKPPSSTPSFSFTFASATYQCWIVRFELSRACFACVLLLTLFGMGVLFYSHH